MFSHVLVGINDPEKAQVWLLHFRLENGGRMSCETSGAGQRGYG
jgi:hypothetical protein